MTARASLLALGSAVAAVLASALPALAACTISTTPVGFGVYDVFSSAPTDSAGTVTYDCTAGSAITITLDRGAAPSFDPRQMADGSQRLNYNLFLDAARATIWGDGSGNTQVHSNASTPGTSVTVTIYGRIPSRQDVPGGTYTSTVTATLNF